MNKPSLESKEKIQDHIKENEAFRLLKLKEEVFHPNTGGKFYFMESVSILVGVVMFLFGIYLMIQKTEQVLHFFYLGFPLFLMASITGVRRIPIRFTKE